MSIHDRRGKHALLTISGLVKDMLPAVNRPGCILIMTNGENTGSYYVPLSPHDCRLQFPEGSRASLYVWDDAKRNTEGIIDTAGNGDRLWDIIGI